MLKNEWPEAPPADGFNPHGISARPEINLMVTSDFILPVSTLNLYPGDPLLRGAIRVWDFKRRKILRTIEIPGAPGTMDVKLIPGDPNRGGQETHRTSRERKRVPYRKPTASDPTWPTTCGNGNGTADTPCACRRMRGAPPAIGLVLNRPDDFPGSPPAGVAVSGMFTIVFGMWIWARPDSSFFTVLVARPSCSALCIFVRYERFGGEKLPKGRYRGILIMSSS